jgi:heterodisulfide reductase subunit A-like polyferredoxin
MINNSEKPFRIPNSAIPSEEIKETYNTDVVVAGAGTSGKAVALSAAEAGAKVIQIDKHVTYRWGQSPGFLVSLYAFFQTGCAMGTGKK